MESHPPHSNGTAVWKKFYDAKLKDPLLGPLISNVVQVAKEMPSNTQVTLHLRDLRLHAHGVFSNVYRGTLVSPLPQREVAIKKTWTGTRAKNFETIFLTGIGRPKHKCIIELLYCWENKYEDSGKDIDKPQAKICESFVFSFSTCTLNSLIRFKPIDITDIKLYTWQLFDGLRYLHDRSIAHRDIKPANLLVDPSAGRLTISDFGSAKFISASKSSVTYQVSRFYRPPEILFGSAYYSCAIDVWSGGCVVGEMMRGSVLFQGRDTMHQTKLIFLCLGMPTEEEVKTWNAPTILKGNYPVQPSGLGHLIRRAHADWIEFLAKILVYIPKQRLCGKQLLEDKFFESIFQKGAQRSNGMSVSSVITDEDRARARIPLERKERKAYERLVKRLQQPIYDRHDKTHKDKQHDMKEVDTKTAIEKDVGEMNKKESLLHDVNNGEPAVISPRCNGSFSKSPKKQIINLWFAKLLTAIFPQNILILNTKSSDMKIYTAKIAVI